MPAVYSPSHPELPLPPMVAPRSGPTDVSLPGVPVAELDKAFPRARSRDVVEFDGATYLRQYRPGARVGTKVQEWSVAWVKQ